MRRRAFLHAVSAALGLGLLGHAARAFAAWNAKAFEAGTDNLAQSDSATVAIDRPAGA